MNFLTTTLPLRTYLFTFALFITVIIYVQNDFSVGSYSIRLSFLMKQIVIVAKKENILTGREAGGGRVWRGLGPRNDVLTSWKAVTMHGGQRIIAVFFPQWTFLDFLEARGEPAEETTKA